MSSKRILVVDDEEKNLALLEAILSPLGHEVDKLTEKVSRSHKG
jgi:CheY-like chemotaxis protein